MCKIVCLDPVRPAPAPKPQARKPPALPKAAAQYDYQAADTDEISLVVGQIVYIVKEGKKLPCDRIVIYGMCEGSTI